MQGLYLLLTSKINKICNLTKVAQHFCWELYIMSGKRRLHDLANGARLRVGSWTGCQDGQQSGGGSDIERGSPRLHEACLSSGFPRLLMSNLACRMADQSLTHSVSRRIIYTSVKPTIIEKTMKPLLHPLMCNFDQRQRLGRGDRNGH